MAALGGFGGRDNNFNIIRCVAALMVVYSHSWGLSVYGEAADPIRGAIGSSLGALAVKVFFIVSGYLVTKSWLRQRSLMDFCRARLFRVIPGLFGVLVFTLFGCGVFLARVDPGYFFSDSVTWKYFYRNLFLVGTQYNLPGVFLDNPYPGVVNGSLWTLRYEIEMYAALAVLGVLGYLVGIKSLVVAVVFFLWYLFCYIYNFAFGLIPVDAELVRLSFCFFVGASCAMFFGRLILSGFVVLLLLGAVMLFRWTPWYDFFSTIFLAYAVFYFAYIPRGLVLLFNRVGDYSYGIYLYSFPIQQAIVSIRSDVGVISLFAISGGLSVLCAVISWHLIERPALLYAKKAVDR